MPDPAPVLLDLNVQCAECGVAQGRHSALPHPFAEALALWPELQPESQLTWLAEEPE